MSFPHPKKTARKAPRTRCIARSAAHYPVGMGIMREFREYLDI